MNIQASQLNPRRPIPFSQMAFEWRRRIIHRHKQHLVHIRAGGDDVVVVVWNGTAMSWPIFLERFRVFCDRYEEVPF